MADPNPVTPPDLLTLQTLYLCGVAYAADVGLMPGFIEKTQVPPSGGVWKCLWERRRTVMSPTSPSWPATSPIRILHRNSSRSPSAARTWMFQISGASSSRSGRISTPPIRNRCLGRDDPARIASGTLNGLAIVQGLTDPATGQTLAQFLTAFVSDRANANVTTVVTGHSLGGCLATIVATWVRTLPLPNYQGAVQPITFAAPTAGNSEFTTYYGELFPTARRFQNTRDIIPLAYYDLSAIGSIYAENMLHTPDIVWLGLLGMGAALNLMDAS